MRDNALGLLRRAGSFAGGRPAQAHVAGLQALHVTGMVSEGTLNLQEEPGCPPRDEKPAGRGKWCWWGATAVTDVREVSAIDGKRLAARG